MLKSALKSTFPKTFARASEAWNGHKRNTFARKMDRLAAAFIQQHGLKVTAGPFEGMTYISDAVCSALLPKLVGSYESELHGVFQQAIARGYAHVIDVGCAEGYYAVGLARAMPAARIFAFDTDAKARDLCTRLAVANGVAGRVQVLGHCSPDSLREVGLGDSLVICDCEGYEGTLLKPDLCPDLLTADFIVELHDFACPGVAEQLRASFATTHDLTLFDPAPHDPANYPALDFLPPQDRSLAVDELRYQSTQFLHLRRKANI